MAACLSVLVGIGVDSAVEPEQLLSYGTVIDPVSLWMGFRNLLNETDFKKHIEMFADSLTDYASMVGEFLNGELAVGRPVQECVDEHWNAFVLGKIEPAAGVVQTSLFGVCPVLSARVGIALCHEWDMWMWCYGATLIECYSVLVLKLVAYLVNA